MRGYAYYNLLQNFGPVVLVGDEPMNTNESPAYYNKERATYDESVDYICNELEIAAIIFLCGLRYLSSGVLHAELRMR